MPEWRQLQIIEYQATHPWTMTTPILMTPKELRVAQALEVIFGYPIECNRYIYMITKITCVTFMYDLLLKHSSYIYFCD